MTNESGSKGYLYCICGVAIIGGLLFGYDTAVISGAEQALQKFFQTGLGENGYSTFVHGFVTSSALVGCVIGGAISGVMAGKLGRKNSLIISSILFFLSALGSYMPEFLFRTDFSFYQPKEATNGLKWAFILYRVLGGIGVGLASAICPMYIAEVSPANIRGKLVSWNQFAIIFGQLLVYAINTVIRSCLGDTEKVIDERMITVGWRRMFVSECVPAALFGILLILVPKTPRYLVLTNRDEKAESVLARINGTSKAKEILEEIKETIRNENNEKSEGLFAYGVVVVIVGMLLSFFQQAVGINVVLYYAKRIFENMGASGNVAMIQTVVMGIVNVFFTFVAIFTVEKVGRRPLLMIGSIGMAIGMIALSVLMFCNVYNLTTLIFIIVYTASFMMSWGPICWVLISEIFPNTIRANAVAIAVAVQWISNLIVSTTFPYLSELSVGGAYLMYGIFSILSALFVYFMVPETKGKTLEDMNNLWLERSGKKKIDNIV
ncbi:MFS transporter, SP family [Anaeromyces robustus]|jgi:SP family xylose:H+ symportor-like MFS transporter|uniref:MFS transporter, SP family n=1 Tax=Anaeromyces robustus TaxID=1754192 RepID=A0A1Y1WTI4_9FUNG|nr:MFS transporter, SP family [Anaeromyces robustus]|eukprot:ORX76608.1 MFS transporter, SP family [Anaeromyces robustus]